MSHRPSTVERAYELARSGKCLKIEDLVRQLKAEGFEAVEAHMSGSSIRAELRQLCKAARA